MMLNNNFYIETFLKDLKIAISYKTQFIFSILSIFITLYFVIIFSTLFDSGENQYLQRYGGDYFTFLIVGIITAEITVVMLNTMPNKVREYQLTGIFEELIMSGRNEIEIISSSISYPLIFQFFRLICYFFAINFVSESMLLFNNFSYISLVSILLFIIALIGISLISTAFTIAFKSPSVINRIYLTLASVLSGVAFPIELLPNFLMNLGSLLPSTHFLELIRADMINNELDFFDAEQSLFILAFSAFILVSLGVFFIRKSIKISKTNGTLLQY